MQTVQLSLSKDGCLVVHSDAVPKLIGRKNRSRSAVEFFRRASGGTEKWFGLFTRTIGRSTNVAGRKVSPEAVERALLTHPQMRGCLVFGTPARDAERTEIIAAIVASGAPELNVSCCKPCPHGRCAA